MDLLSYVLITPARNEAELIGETIRAVIGQTHKPKRWIIVSDGSTDNTDNIVSRYCQEYPWMSLVRMPEGRDRSFAAKVACFNAGWQQVKELEYDIIGNLDADITFDKDYFEYLVNRLMSDRKLGVVGTPFVEESGHYDYRFTNIEHVSGACQLFRRECFEDIGGYLPIKGGGIDWVAVTTARMKGWKTRTFTDKVCFHHRKMGTGQVSAWAVGFKKGEKDYYLGGHPLWQIFRCLYQMTRKPYLIAGVSLFGGFCWAWIRGAEKPIGKELIEFHRKEQMLRLKKTLLG